MSRKPKIAGNPNYTIIRAMLSQQMRISSCVHILIPFQRLNHPSPVLTILEVVDFQEQFVMGIQSQARLQMDQYRP